MKFIRKEQQSSNYNNHLVINSANKTKYREILLHKNEVSQQCFKAAKQKNEKTNGKKIIFTRQISDENHQKRVAITNMRNN